MPRLFVTGLWATGLWDGKPSVPAAGGGGGGSAETDRWWRSPPRKARKAKTTDTDTGAPIEAPLPVSDEAMRTAEAAVAAAIRAQTAQQTEAVIAEIEAQQRQQELEDDALTVLLLAA